MKKEVRIDGFIDVGTVKEGSKMVFIHNGRWYQSSTIIKCSVHAGKVYAETKNTVYYN